MDVPENLRLRRRRAITELLKGKASVVQLQTLLQNLPPDGASTLLSAELAQEICRSFTQAIFELTSGDAAAQICQIPSASACSGGLTFEDSGETTGTNKKKGRKGRYKKSKNSETWNKVSETQEDGGAWRKYGQKNILHSESPRCYFRCTHKRDQGCRATKQVQRTSEGLYQTTYFGYHTCKDPQRFPRRKTDHVAGAFSGDAPNDHQTMVEAANKQMSLQEEEEDGGAIDTVKKEEETAQSEISISKSPDNNDKCYDDDDNFIWGDIIGESSNYDTSFYACSSTSFSDLDMGGVADFDTFFPHS
ncbi:PREDICTED: probable WRKY transcription factor 70 [Ipomoea nil]|uniref:probable WRKY transcription factor 70 n=1 Tax=Ipomoea nil TaxID=35883 RepID=UPI00090085C3|nr:PREDICTED: probable WRKY transcription factor 70 [Ipomoea nil]